MENVILIGAGMGQARIRQAQREERIKKYMENHTKVQQHGADVHVPSDTEQFDNKASEGLSPLQIRTNEVTSRFVAFFQWAASNPRIGMSGLLAMTYLQMKMNYCGLMAANEIFAAKLGVTTDEILDKTLDFMERDLFNMQTENGIIITTQEVVAMPKTEQ